MKVRSKDLGVLGRQTFEKIDTTNASIVLTGGVSLADTVTKMIRRFKSSRLT